MNTGEFLVVGGGLAGSEAAWQLAQAGVNVKLYEMRPANSTGAHQTDRFAELVCSNSLGSNLIDRPAGLLKAELKRMGSMVLGCAEMAAVPAGGALAVDREVFSQLVTEQIQMHPRIVIIRQEVTELPGQPAIIASGPLTSVKLAESIKKFSGSEHLYFYDAIAPIVALDSLNMEIAFRASRRDYSHPQEGDYINCPFTEAEYSRLVSELAGAERIQLKDFENDIEEGVHAGPSHFFEGCLPVEIIARRSAKALAFGPMRPIGLKDPRTGKRPIAVVQLRQDNIAGTLYNLVGFQTNLTVSEQKRVFRLIPGLEKARFERYGQMHRNTFINAPLLLNATMQTRSREDLFFAGQITGVEGYIGNIATGLVAGLNAARWAAGKPLRELPLDTMIGALCHYISAADANTFQPMKANFGLLPPVEEYALGKKGRALLHSQKACASLEHWMGEE
jgi:methylenetetrahydrofolate--tRNA-(uracil-5-)-methyltransferase